jgi:hypothetical protein
LVASDEYCVILQTFLFALSVICELYNFWYWNLIRKIDCN